MYTEFKEQSHVPRIPSDTIVGTSMFAFKPIRHHHKSWRQCWRISSPIKPMWLYSSESSFNSHRLAWLGLIFSLKVCSSSIAKPFSDLVNSIISSSQVTNTWKCGHVTSLYEQGSVLDKKNRRRETVFHVFSKRFERLIHIYMREYLEPIFSFPDYLGSFSDLWNQISHAAQPIRSTIKSE